MIVNSLINRNSEMSSEELNTKSESIIKNHVIWSMGAGLVPIPMLDIVAVSAVQLDMVRQLSKVYDLDFSETQGKAMITSMTGSSLAKLGARAAIKLIPGIGSIVGGVAMATLSGASTYALGEVYKKHFETGGTFLDFDPGRFKKVYKEKFEKGKKVAEELRRSQESTKETGFVIPGQDKQLNPMNTDVLAKLKELGELKSTGVISEAEFEDLKKKMLS